MNLSPGEVLDQSNIQHNYIFKAKIMNIVLEVDLSIF